MKNYFINLPEIHCCQKSFHQKCDNYEYVDLRTDR